jgi:hypothetical protein
MIILILALISLTIVVINHRSQFSLGWLFKKEEPQPKLVNQWNRRANGQFKRKIPVKRMGQVTYYFYL